MRKQSLLALTKVLTFSLLFISSGLWAQNFEWAISQGGTDKDDATALCTDAQGNVYMTGYFKNTVDFDPRSATNEKTSNGKEDVFVQKLDKDGNPVWIKTFGGSYKDVGHDITVDDAGNVYVVGEFLKTVDFNPDGTSHSVTGQGTFDAFIVKYTSNGDFSWAKTIGSNNKEEATKVAVDPNGNIYVGGYYKGLLDFDPGTGVFEMTPQGGYDFFVEKLDANGDFVWAKGFGGSGDDELTQMLVDANGDVYMTGTFEGTVDFDPGTNVTNGVSAGLKNGFAEKLGTDGSFVGVKFFESNANVYPYDMAFANDGTVIIAGSFEGTTNFEPGTQNFELTSAGQTDCFIQKFTTDGNIEWVKTFGAAFSEQINAITVAPDNGVHLVGQFSSSLTVDPTLASLTSEGSIDIFQAVYNPQTEHFSDLYSFGDLSVDVPNDIAMTSAGEIYTVGSYTSGTIDFDPTDSTSTYTSIGGQDMYIQKFSQCIQADVPAYTVSANQICEGETINFNVVSGNLNSATQWVWHKDHCDGPVVAEGTTANDTPTETTTYYLAAEGGCITEPVCQTIEVMVNPKFKIQENIDICGQSYTFPDGTTIDNITEPMIHKSVLTAVTGCDSTIATTVNPVQINTEVTMDGNTLVAASQIAEFQWIDCDTEEPITGATGPTFTPTESGNYAVIIYKNGCQQTSDCQAITIVATQEPTWKKDVQVFPNPITDVLNIDLGTTFKEGQATLIHMTGKKISEMDLAGQRKIQFDVNELTPGVYYLEITRNGTPSIFKIVK